jgi:hypothetical protein
LNYSQHSIHGTLFFSLAGVSRRFRSFRMTAIHASGWNLKELRREGKFGQRTKRHLSTPPISMFKQLVPRFRTRVGRTSQKNFFLLRSQVNWTARREAKFIDYREVEGVVVAQSADPQSCTSSFP